jgi:hypothetical protein
VKSISRRTLRTSQSGKAWIQQPQVLDMLIEGKTLRNKYAPLKFQGVETLLLDWVQLRPATDRQNGHAGPSVSHDVATDNDVPAEYRDAESVTQPISLASYNETNGGPTTSGHHFSLKQVPPAGGFSPDLRTPAASRRRQPRHLITGQSS